MQLNTTEQRRHSVEILIEEAIAFQETMDIEDKDEDNDWCGASVVIDDLTAVEEMMNAEIIFRDTLAKISSPHHYNSVDKEAYAAAFADGYDSFICDILLSRLYHAADILDDWGFRTEGGQKFQEDFSEKLAALIDVYENFDDLLTEADETLENDTPEERLAVVTKLFHRASKISDVFKRKEDRVSFGDVLGLMALMEKLTAIQDVIRTEALWEQTFADMENIKDVSEDVREKFFSTVAGNGYVFIRTVLMQRMETAVSFANNDFNDRQLMKFQKDFRETLSGMCEKYRQIYKI